MATGVFGLINRRVITSRESIDLLRPALRLAARETERVLQVDFAGVEAVSPAAIDQLLVILDEELMPGWPGKGEVLLKSVPAVLSGKYLAIAIAHRTFLKQMEGGDWVLRKSVGAVRP